MSEQPDQPPSTTTTTTTTARLELSCTKCFDAVWLCYSPVHQLQQYYRLGLLDNCSKKWSDLYDCLRLKTKSSSERQEILEAHEKEKAKSHIWSFRTPEESAAQWQQWYGYLDEMESEVKEGTRKKWEIPFSQGKRS